MAGRHVFAHPEQRRADGEILRPLRLELWLARSRQPPKIHDTPIPMHSSGMPAGQIVMDDSHCQLPADEDRFYPDPEYSWDQYIHAEA
jgi:hypothetical protein